MANTTDRLYRMPIGDFLRRRPEAQTCQACGSPLPHAAVFCPSCGVRTDDPQATSAARHPPGHRRGGHRSRRQPRPGGRQRRAQASGRAGGGRPGLHPSWAARARRCGHRKRKPLAALGPARDDGQARLTLEVYLARHGETEWSVSGQHTGVTDIPLTRRGEAKAAALGRTLAGITFDAVYSSPMQRARRTAELAGFDDPQVTSLLQEVDYGQYEGLTSQQIHELDPDWEVYKDGCPDGESPAQIYARAQAFIQLVARHGDARGISFAHGHILRAVAVAWIDADLRVATGLQLDVATLNILRDADRGRVVALWNAS